MDRTIDYLELEVQSDSLEELQADVYATYPPPTYGPNDPKRANGGVTIVLPQTDRPVLHDARGRPA
jgi:hypothetical protein